MMRLGKHPQSCPPNPQEYFRLATAVKTAYAGIKKPWEVVARSQEYYPDGIILTAYHNPLSNQLVISCALFTAKLLNKHFDLAKAFTRKIIQQHGSDCEISFTGYHRAAVIMEELALEFDYNCVNFNNPGSLVKANGRNEARITNYV